MRGAECHLVPSISPGCLREELQRQVPRGRGPRQGNLCQREVILGSTLAASAWARSRRPGAAHPAHPGRGAAADSPPPFHRLGARPQRPWGRGWGDGQGQRPDRMPLRQRAPGPRPTSAGCAGCERSSPRSVSGDRSALGSCCASCARREERDGPGLGGGGGVRAEPGLRASGAGGFLARTVGFADV